MNYFLGIDGGGTKSKCVLVDENINVIFEAYGNASNPLSVGFSKAALSITELIIKTFQSTEVRKINSIVIGLAGAGRENQIEEIKLEILELLSTAKCEFDYFSVVSDAAATLEGAFAGKPGAIVIAGTGSIIFGKDNKNNFYRVGGFGKIIGDEGSGYTIARKGLNTVAKEYDGFKIKTLLTNLLREEYQIGSKEDLVNKVYSKDFDVAAVARHVIDSAQQGDKHCRRIIREEISQLVSQLDLLKQRINIKVLNVALSGGLAGSDNYYSQELERKILSTLDGIVIKKIKYPPEIGAALIAKKILTKN